MTKIEEAIRELVEAEIKAALANHSCHCPPKEPEAGTPYLRTPDAARYCGLAAGTLSNMKSLGLGPKAYKHGRLTVYYASDLDYWLEGRLVLAESAM